MGIDRVLTECSEPSIHPHPCPSIQAQLSKQRAPTELAGGSSCALHSSQPFSDTAPGTQQHWRGAPCQPLSPRDSSCAHLARNSTKILVPTTTAPQGQSQVSLVRFPFAPSAKVLPLPSLPQMKIPISHLLSTCTVVARVGNWL